MDGAYDMSMDTDIQENDQVPMLTLYEVLDQHLLNKMAHNGVIVPQIASASSSTAAAATSCTKKTKKRRRGEMSFANCISTRPQRVTQ